MCFSHSKRLATLSHVVIADLRQIFKRIVFKFNSRAQLKPILILAAHFLVYLTPDPGPSEYFRKKKGVDERQEVEKSVTDQEQR